MTDIDPALAVELDALELQKPMNNVIDRGDSPIQQLYRDTTVFITGGCGFIGKHLIEKLLRACNIKKIFVLIRPKKYKTIQSRIDATLSNPVYDTLRKKQPNFAERVVPIEGDISDIRLGLTDENWKLLTEQVNIIFHAAATVRFNEPLRTATITNVRGTREVLQLARECKTLLQFVQVSTAFAQATKDNINKKISEDFYTCPVPPHTLISLAENLEENRLKNITRKFIDGWPNTYTFTKAVAEELVRTAGDLPACIIRPPMVQPAYYEPSPGWLDFSTVMGPSGICLGVVMGVIHVLCVDNKIRMAIAPIDIVNNVTIAAVWDSLQRKNTGENKIPVYTVANEERFVTYEFTENTFRNKCKDIFSPKAVWYCGGYVVKNVYLYAIMSLFLHYIPAYILDAILFVVGKKPKEITSVNAGAGASAGACKFKVCRRQLRSQCFREPRVFKRRARAQLARVFLMAQSARIVHTDMASVRFVDVYRKFDKSLKAYDYFQSNEWYFQDYNIQVMIKKLTPADQVLFNCNLMTVDLVKYYKIFNIGVRKYIIQDGLQGSAEGLRRQNIFKILNYFVCTLYIYLLWLIFNAIIKMLVFIFL